MMEKLRLKIRLNTVTGLEFDMRERETGEEDLYFSKDKMKRVLKQNVVCGNFKKYMNMLHGESFNMEKCNL